MTLATASEASGSAGSVNVAIGVVLMVIVVVILIVAFRASGGDDESGPDDDGPGGSRRRPPGDPHPESPVCWPEFEQQFAEYVAATRPGSRR